MARISTTELVNKVFAFCQAYSGVNFFDYQAQFAKRLIRSVLENDGEEMSALFSRQCIAEGSVIHDRDGKLYRIEEHPRAWKTGDNERILEIRVKGGSILRCTSNHPVYTSEGWKDAGDLTVEDKVATLLEWDNFGDGKVPYNFTKYVNKHSTETITGSLTMNEELAELLGWLTSDGSITQSVKFTNNNPEYLSRVEYLVGSNFPNIDITRYPKGNGFDLLFTTKGDKSRFNPLKDFIRMMDFDKSKFPKSVNYFTREQVVAFFRGMFPADGYVNVKSSQTIDIGLSCGNSRTYAEFNRELLNKLGIRGQIKEEWHSKSTAPFYRIIITGQRNILKFKETIGDILGKPIPDISRSYSRLNTISPIIEEDGEALVFNNVVSIRDAGSSPVWDVEYPVKEWFMCGGVKVHNSGKSEVAATVSGGMAILLPILSNMPMFVEDNRLKHFKDGMLIGIFAPSLNQAQISFGRMKSRMNSRRAHEVMNDPEIGVTFEASNGINIVLSNGSIITCQSASEGTNIEGKSYMLIIVDEAQDVSNFKYIKSISPMGAFYNATKVLIGTPTTQVGFFYNSIQRNLEEQKSGGRRNHFEYNYLTVIKYNERYAKYVEGEKKRFGEDSDEFRMSFKLEWILQRGMFITKEVFDSMADPNLGTILVDHEKSHVVGIDLGKKNDSTVVTVLEVDWDNPVIEKSTEPDVPDYVAYPCLVKNWLELQGDGWEEQYSIICDFISNYNVVRMVIDATGVGDSIYDRFRANMKFEVIPYAFSKQSKSDLYKHLNSEIRAGRVRFPSDPNVVELREFPRFTQQMLDLEKSYSGQFMVVSHPEVRGAHDDYPDSLALAVFGAKGEPVSKPATERERIYGTPNAQFTNARNTLTARRR